MFWKKFWRWRKRALKIRREKWYNVKMVITYYGLSCFKVQSGDLTIVFDPPSKDSELKPPRFEVHAALSSHAHPKHNGAKELPGKKEGGPFVISGPGEYEMDGLAIDGIPSFHDGAGGKKLGRNTIYKVKMEEITLCHLGDFGEAELRPETLEAIGEVDVLFLPVGGKDVLDAEGAAKVLNQIEPKIAIPMHFSKPGEFLEELGEKTLQAEEKFTFKKKELGAEGTKVVLLKPINA